MRLDLSLSPDLSGRVRLGVLVLEGLSVHERDDGLIEEVDSVAGELRARHGSTRSGDIPGVEEARQLYKALGIDPTKTRPSNEALLRRALKGESLYRINALVDALNLCSLRLQVPFGLYDLAAISGAVELRMGRAGEGYEGIRKGRVNVDARPILCDALGPFGNPTSDSARTSISTTTRKALVVAYVPKACRNDRLRAVLDATGECLTTWCGGCVAELTLVPED